MKQYLCKSCGKPYVNIDMTIDPNSHITIHNYCLQSDIDEEEGWCHNCNTECQIITEKIDSASAYETPQIDLWHQNLVDMFIVSVTNFRVADGQSTSGSDTIFYSIARAKMYFKEYVKQCGVKPNKETYTVFQIRHFDPEVENRAGAYPDEQSIFDFSEFSELKSIYERIIK